MPSKRAEVIRAEVRESYGTPEAIAKYVARIDGGLATWEQAVLRQYLPAAGETLVIGCGAGRELFGLESLGYGVTGIDVSPALIEAAQREAQARGSSARISLADGRTLSFPDESFDIVTLWSQVLANVPFEAGRQDLLSEVHRVLRPGGVATFSVHDDQLTRPLLDPRNIMAVDDPEPGDLFHREEAEGAVRYMHYFSIEEVRHLCKESGFDLPIMLHTSDLGQAWGNVLVVVCVKEPSGSCASV
jgi:SAM-dependent methyltransferase